METLLHLFAETTKRVISICVAAALLLAWAITGPLFYLNDLAHERFNKKMKEIL